MVRPARVEKHVVLFLFVFICFYLFSFLAGARRNISNLKK